MQLCKYTQKNWSIDLTARFSSGHTSVTQTPVSILTIAGHVTFYIYSTWFVCHGKVCQKGAEQHSLNNAMTVPTRASSKIFWQNPGPSIVISFSQRQPVSIISKRELDTSSYIHYAFQRHSEMRHWTFLHDKLQFYLIPGQNLSLHIIIYCTKDRTKKTVLRVLVTPKYFQIYAHTLQRTHVCNGYGR